MRNATHERKTVPAEQDRRGGRLLSRDKSGTTDDAVTGTRRRR